MEQACHEGDRLACDTLEFEGRPPRPFRRAAQWVAGSAPWQPTRAELACTLLPLLLLALTSRMWGRRRRGRPAAGGDGSAALLRSRRLAALDPQHKPSESTQQQFLQEQEEARRVAAAMRQPDLPPHPAAAAAAATPGASPDAPALPPHAPTTTGSSLLAAADTALSSLLVLPFSLLQHAKYMATRGGGSTAAASGEAPAAQRVTVAAVGHGPSTPEVPLASPLSQKAGGSGGGKMYGLGIGEAESEEDEWSEGGGESELTQACLRRLQQSAEFKTFLKARGMTTSHVGSTARRLRLYRRLRRLDPTAFWTLLRPGSRAVFDSRPPSRLLLATEYLLTSFLNLAAAAAVYSLLWGDSVAAGAALGVRGTGVGLLLWAVMAQWMRGRPTSGGCFGLWYEEERWGHAAPGWRCVAASMLETAYIVGSAGLGLFISLYLRCLSARRQSVGELLAAVHPIQEVLLLPTPWED